MNPKEGEPLWWAVVGDPEPWRRGRLFLVLLAILSFFFQCLSLGYGILSGDIEGALVLGIFVLVFWLQYYFIWIGVHWVRWLNGAWSALAGFVLVIWGFRDGAALGIALGLYSFGVGAYLALAPSVYFFAKRQRESVRRMDSLIIAAVFLLLLGSLSAGVLGLMGYKTHLEREARRFADTAFMRIFADHDGDFLLEHATDRLLKADNGREQLPIFMQDAMRRAGNVHDIKPSAGWLRFWFSFPSQFGSAGQMVAEGVGDHGRIRMHLKVGEAGGPWKVDGVRWTYFDSVPELHSPQ